MLKKFFPDETVDRVQDIDLSILKNKGIKGFILDVDNTLVPSFMKEADENALNWIKKLKDSGFKLCIVSNATKRRVDRFNEKIGLRAIYRAAKPIGRPFKKALKLLDLKAKEAAAIGDQIFTDIYGGNRLGIHTILVKPINTKESLFVRLKRFPEKIVLKHYYKMIEEQEQ